jgi:superfamily II DNA/RNA helicase
MDQSARTAALDQFRKNEVTLLVASDVAARGLDIPDVSHVYNFDAPIHADDYVHRIGRTGRAGRSGTAITIVAGSNDTKAVAAIEKLIGQPIPFMDSPGGSPAGASPAAEAPEQPRASRGRGRRDDHRRQPQHRPAPVARIDEARSRRAPPPGRPLPTEDSEVSHLPAFLLRPVKLKA